MPAPTLARVARTPTPPYYAVTTTTELRPEFDTVEHLRLGAELYRCAQGMQGFLGLEVFFQHGASIAVSYWSDTAAIDRWRAHPLHGAAKSRARADWFGATITRIARVEADYGFNLDTR
jgi:heme-degrading monooxygenase HmoA